MNFGDKKEFGGLVNDLYAAALGDVSWSEAMEGLRSHAGTRLATWLWHDLETGEIGIRGAASDDSAWKDHMLKIYAQEFDHYDPAREPIKHWSNGHWLDDAQEFSTDIRDHGIFHQEFLYANSVGSWSGVVLSRSDRHVECSHHVRT